MPVQLRFDTGLAGDQYVTRQVWRLATLLHCPLHPRGGCGFARHGTYARKTPPGTLVARWYCRLGHCTFSLLPDHLAAHLPGTLREVEQVVLAAEAAPSLQSCADALRPDAVGLVSALRWLHRRLDPVRALLPSVLTLLPEALLGCMPRLSALGQRLGLEDGGSVLEWLRPMLASELGALASPLGLRRRRGDGGAALRRLQQPMGPDPPPGPG